MRCRRWQQLPPRTAACWWKHVPVDVDRADGRRARVVVRTSANRSLSSGQHATGCSKPTSSLAHGHLSTSMVKCPVRKLPYFQSNQRAPWLYAFLHLLYRSFCGDPRSILLFSKAQLSRGKKGAQVKREGKMVRQGVVRTMRAARAATASSRTAAAAPSGGSRASLSAAAAGSRKPVFVDGARIPFVMSGTAYK